ncbi:MAG: molybdopterin molybdotransferase MoeA [Ancrocorticia sp.]|uniref:molybdopterin molybdotransferase MoeA n=1 Tax=Ancrocorticia sp. TaxID=2593684 RepID=UPI003F9165F5
MKSVEAHLKDCLDLAAPIERYEVELPDALGCILAEDVLSMTNVPAADIAAQDGYAVRGADTIGASAENPVRLRVLGELYSDSGDASSVFEGTAMKIASGVRLPAGADSVVPLESTDQDTVSVTLYQSVRAQDYVRTQGEDLRVGSVALTEGTRIAARHIALLASSGRALVPVHPAPRVVVMSVGSELVAPGRGAPAGKIYDANSHALSSAVKSAGGVAYRVGAVSDDKNVLRDAIEDQLLRADVIITTGGLSYGGGDTIKEVLSPLGSVRFDNVAMNPGRQLGVGSLEDDTVIFCLPGDPVAALVSFEVFVRPALRKMAGYASIGNRSIAATASDTFFSTAGERDYVRVHVTGNTAKGYRFQPTEGGQNPLITGFAEANGLAVIPEDVTKVQQGDSMECIILNG